MPMIIKLKLNDTELKRVLEPLIVNEDRVEQTRGKVDKESGKDALKNLLTFFIVGCLIISCQRNVQQSF